MYRLSNKILSWIPQEDIEEKALEQIKNISEMPFIFNHIAVMPDCHLGKGATVGSCIPTSGAIIPAAVEETMLLVCNSTSIAGIKM